MDRFLQMCRKIGGALGWLLLGCLLMHLEIGPWWVGWLPMALSSCVITLAIVDVMEPVQRWRV